MTTDAIDWAALSAENHSSPEATASRRFEEQQRAAGAEARRNGSAPSKARAARSTEAPSSSAGATPKQIEIPKPSANGCDRKGNEASEAEDDPHRLARL